MICAALAGATANAADKPAPAESNPVDLTLAPETPLQSEPTSWRDLSRWSFQVGVGFITKSSVDDILTLGGELAESDDGGGEIYLLQASYKLAAIRTHFWDMPAEFDVELPMVLGLVDENQTSIFPQYSAGVTLRWKNLPWNRWLYTNLETGVGLTYSSQVLGTERARHVGRDRSHLEFYWPIQVMLAHPRYRQHQLVLFNHHHSGGTIFHKGGANTLGVGYRYVFEEAR